MPPAATLMRTSPSAGSGIGRSWTEPAAPNSSRAKARMRRPPYVDSTIVAAQNYTKGGLSRVDLERQDWMHLDRADVRRGILGGPCSRVRFVFALEDEVAVQPRRLVVHRPIGGLWPAVTGPDAAGRRRKLAGGGLLVKPPPP